MMLPPRPSHHIPSLARYPRSPIGPRVASSDATSGTSRTLRRAS
ncbi:hypothetical protein CPAR01_13118 [Colletotrichum paranaense]|nr:uncharacterized protein CPAR01_13118 [Colletotrichum paranaense]KAK0369211.1 hypothetical protein CLIM01_13435 [Colletotrichum limetticola]KAK1526590.1 hypothetical protein CPAR01_13118 [Colletotrichum paranaense]